MPDCPKACLPTTLTAIRLLQNQLSTALRPQVSNQLINHSFKAQWQCAYLECTAQPGTLAP